MDNNDKNNKLKILTFNVNGLASRKWELELLLNDHPCDLICLQETKTKEKPLIRGYDCVKFTPRGPGVLGTAIFSKICEDTIDDNLPSLHKGMETVSATIHLPKNKSVRIISTYNSPQNKIPVDEISKLSKGNIVTLLVGDTNAKIDIPLHRNTNANGDALDQECSKGEIIAITAPTYTRYDPGGRDPSAIDMIICDTRHAHLIDSIEVLKDIGSDHRPVLVTLTLLKKNTTPTVCSRKPIFDKADWLEYRCQMSSKLQNASEIRSNKPSIDGSVIFVEESIQNTDQNSIPRRKPFQPSSKPIPQYILDIIHRKEHLRNRVNKYRETWYRPEVRRLEKKIRKELDKYELTETQKKWENSSDKSPHGYYKLAKEIISPSMGKSTFPLKDDHGIRIDKDEDKARVFRELYQDIYSAPPPNEIYEDLENEANDYYNYIREKYAEVKEREWPEGKKPTCDRARIIRVLKNTTNTAPGEDQIYYDHIKNLPVDALDYLAELYQTCLRCCYWPQRWKLGLTCLFPKPNKDHSLPKSYRPLTMLSAVGKTLERIYNEDLTEELEETGIIPDSQAGFRPGRSTQDQLFRLIQDATTSVTNGSITMATLFDIEKAYDKIWKQGLALKLRGKLRETTIAMILDYLSDRSIRLKVNNAISESVHLLAGTPQGSIISPNIFNLSVHDIPQPKQKKNKNPDANLSQYADDIGTWANAREYWTVREKLQLYNNEIIQWCSKWKIKLAEAKTQLIAFTKPTKLKKSSVYQYIGETRVEHSDTVTFLGVTMDTDMSWRTHSDQLNKRLKQRVQLFAGITGSRNRPKAGTEISLKIFKSMIEPLIYYAPAALCARPKKYFDKQDELLARAARLALHIPFSISRKYTTENAKLEESLPKTLRLAKNYMTNEKRACSTKKFFNDRIVKSKKKYNTKIQSPAWAIKSVL